MLEVGCSGCGGRISDRYIMRVGERSYHERCLLCSVCTSPLTQTCFIRDLKLLCRTDYERLYQKKCLSCGETIGPSELVMRASLEAVFHLRCFLCVVCGSPLQKGDQYVVKQGQLFCRPDYEKEVEMFQGYAQGETPLGEDGTPTRTDGRRGPKRPRTILTTQQRRAFKASFELSPKPCRKVRETLAKDTGLSVRIVQVWFQNQRAKIKKMQKKHRLDQKNNNSNDKDLELDEKLDKIKDDDHSSQGGCVGVTSYLGDSCSDTEVLPTDFSTGARVKEERDDTAFYRNIMADQQGISSYLQPHEGTKCEERYSCGDGQQQPTQQPYEPYFLGLQQPPTQQQNPIDRLYSMQSSYFEQELIHQHH